MQTLRVLGVYLVTLGAFLALDALWLGVVARGLYKRELGHLLAPEVRWGAAAVFYLLYVAGVLAVVVWPNHDHSLWRTVVLGGIFGLCAYAAYDLTNMATLPRWPVLVTAVDMVWGTVLTGATAAAGWWAVRRLMTG
jgi:uncharacterized membrane protein